MYDLTVDQEDSILANFKEVIDSQDTSLIADDLYNHLNLNCNFSSYFGLNGFRNAFTGEDGFREFAERFDRQSALSQWVEAPEISVRYANLNNSIVDYATSHLRQPPSIH